MPQKKLTGYQQFVKDRMSGTSGLKMADIAAEWRSMSDLDKQDYGARSGVMTKKKPAPRKIPGPTKKKMFIEMYLESNPYDLRADAEAMWKALSQADRDAYIGLL